MAYAYHDYESQATDALRLDQLLLHMAEVRQRMSEVSVSGAGYSRSPDLSSINAYLATLENRRAELQRRVAITSGSRVTHARPRRPS